MTPRRLVLVRHSKTEQGHPDARRALTARGHRDAAAIGRWLLANDVVPDLVVVSPALRAEQTWQGAAQELAQVPVAVEDPRLYDNTFEDVLAVVHDAHESLRTMVVVGHNPSIHECVARLARPGDDAWPGEVKTSSVALFDIDGEWAGVGDGAGRLVAFATCRG